VSALIVGAHAGAPLQNYVKVDPGHNLYIMGVKPAAGKVHLGHRRTLIARPISPGVGGRRVASRCCLADRALRQGEIKTGPAVDLAFGPDAAAVTLDNALHQGQPYAGAFKFLIAVQPLKHPE
jgi:hypothetical protein